MTYNALKCIDITDFVNILVCFLVSCSHDGGHVSPVRTMAVHRRERERERKMCYSLTW